MAAQVDYFYHRLVLSRVRTVAHGHPDADMRLGPSLHHAYAPGAKLFAGRCISLLPGQCRKFLLARLGTLEIVQFTAGQKMGTSRFHSSHRWSKTPRRNEMRKFPCSSAISAPKV